jgi:hypothetical protein
MEDVRLSYPSPSTDFCIHMWSLVIVHWYYLPSDPSAIPSFSYFSCRYIIDNPHIGLAYPLPLPHLPQAQAQQRDYNPQHRHELSPRILAQ